MLVLFRMSESEAEKKMNKGFVAWAQYLEEWVIFHVALFQISSPSSQLGPKIISVHACVCALITVSVTVCLCMRTSFQKHNSTSAPNLPTWQLAPLITKSNTHQWMSNEAFLRELWLTTGLGSTPQVWITYYVLLNHSVKYTDEWMSSTSAEILPQTWQSFDLRQTGWGQASRRQFKSAVCAAYMIPAAKFTLAIMRCRNWVSELSIQSKLVFNKGTQGKSFLKSIVLQSPCLTLEAHTHSW